MNKQESDIMKILLQTPFINQRMLAEASGHSLGVVNRSVKELVAQGYLDEQLWPTSRAKKEFQERSPKRAIILAAGFGMRMVPPAASAAARSQTLSTPVTLHTKAEGVKLPGTVFSCPAE